MKVRPSLAIVLWGAIAATLQAALPTGRPHPAVVRIIAPESDGVSYGSGALVAVNDRHGLVVTNWHVVRDATGQIEVVFADGFRSAATVLRTDPDWDLAALAVWRPNADPIPLATHAPRPGESLTIAGYGSGRYRTVTGRCTQYVSPGGNHPFEMVELSAGARNGDSGGPIFNSRGELAGVLFGAAFGQTTGSYCGRVHTFLAPVADDFRRASPAATMIARQPVPPPGPVDDGWRPSREHADAVREPAETPVAAIASRPPPVPAASDWSPNDPSEQVELHPNAPQAEGAETIGILGTTRLEQIKTVLAAVGLLAIFLHGLALLSRAEGK